MYGGKNSLDLSKLHIQTLVSLYLYCLLYTDVLQTVDYMASDGVVAFRTCERERAQLVFQMVSQYRNGWSCHLVILSLHIYTLVSSG